MAEAYSCGKCGTTSDEEGPLVMTTSFLGGSEVRVSCMAKGCGRSVTRPTLAEAFAAIGKPVETKSDSQAG